PRRTLARFVLNCGPCAPTAVPQEAGRTRAPALPTPRFPNRSDSNMAQTLTPTPGGLAVSPRIEERLRQGELTAEQVEDFRDFLAQVDRELMRHRIITDNPYTRWFARGEATDAELKHFIKQFS